MTALVKPNKPRPCGCFSCKNDTTQGRYCWPCWAANRDSKRHVHTYTQETNDHTTEDYYRDQYTPEDFIVPGEGERGA